MDILKVKVDGQWVDIPAIKGADADLTAYRTSAAQDIIDATKVPTSRTINAKPMSSDVSITATDIPYSTTDVGSELGRLDGKFGDYRTASAQDVIDGTKQDALVSGTNIKTINGSSILGSGNMSVGGGSNRNLLDNPWFTINQRGFTTSSATSQAYTVDRWVASNPSHISVTSNGILIANDGYAVRQMSETELENGKTYTYSLLFSDGTIRSHTFTASSSVKRISHLIKTNTWEELGASYNIVAQFTQGDGVHVVRAVKLELGTVSTLSNDVAPNYAEELLKCQRYYQTLWVNPALAVAYNSTSLRFGIIFPTTMRTTPTCTITSPQYFDGSYKGATSTDSFGNQNMFAIDYYVTSITANRTYFATGGITFSADL